VTAANGPPTRPALIVPLDGSTQAELALAPASQLADRLDAELVLVTAAEASHAERCDTYLDGQRGSVDRHARSLVVVDRNPADAIETCSREGDALVCMTTHGRGALTASVLGSVAETVVRRAKSPVVLVGPRCRGDWQLGPAPVLVAGFDGSDRSRAGVRAAGDFATALGGRVRVVEMFHRPDVVAVSRFNVDGVDVLEDAVGELRVTGVDADYEVVDGLDPADVLIEIAIRDEASLVAVATHGRHGVARVALGSVTTRLVRYSPVPVLVVCPDASVGSSA